MRKIIPARVRVSTFFFCAVCAAGSKHNIPTGLSTVRCIRVRFPHDTFALLYFDIMIPVKILAVTYLLKAIKLHLGEPSNAESSTVIKDNKFSNSKIFFKNLKKKR